MKRLFLTTVVHNQPAWGKRKRRFPFLHTPPIPSHCLYFVPCLLSSSYTPAQTDSPRQTIPKWKRSGMEALPPAITCLIRWRPSLVINVSLSTLQSTCLWKSGFLHPVMVWGKLSSNASLLPKQGNQTEAAKGIRRQPYGWIEKYLIISGIFASIHPKEKFYNDAADSIVIKLWTREAVKRARAWWFATPWVRVNPRLHADVSP